MKKQIVGLGAFLLVLTLSAGLWAKSQPSGPAQPVLGTQVFLGGIYFAGDDDNWSGSLTSQDRNPCVLTVPSGMPAGIGIGGGPNGGILFNASGKSCVTGSGTYELLLSGGVFPTQGGIGSFTGVYSGTFALVSTVDEQTVSWAGTFTQVYNINPTGFGCAGLGLCANFTNFGSETFNGFGLSFVLELNALALPRQ